MLAYITSDFLLIDWFCAEPPVRVIALTDRQTARLKACSHQKKSNYTHMQTPMLHNNIVICTLNAQAPKSLKMDSNWLSLFLFISWGEKTENDISNHLCCHCCRGGVDLPMPKELFQLC